MNIVVSGEGAEVYFNSGFEEDGEGNVYVNNKKEQFATKKYVDEQVSTTDDDFKEELAVMTDNIENLRYELHKLKIEIDEMERENIPCETIIFQTNIKLEKDSFPFVLGMKGPSNKNFGFIVPYNGYIDMVTISSQEMDQEIKVNLYVNGLEVAGLDRPINIYYKQNHLAIPIENGDIIQFQSDCETVLAKSMHTVQVTLRYTEFEDRPIKNAKYVPSENRDNDNLEQKKQEF